jgi:hypothetical protein
VTVEPQATQITADEGTSVSQANETTTQSSAQIPPQKTPEEMQKEAEANGLQVWGPDSWSILPPFFKLHARAEVGSLEIDNQLWVGLFACGIDKCSGLCSLLQKAFENLDAAARDVAYSAIIAMLTSVYALIWFNAVAASLATITIGGYISELALYTALTLVTILGFQIIPDALLSKALLFGVGFALIGVLLTALWNDPQARIFPGILKQQLTGADPATSAAKCVLTVFLITVSTANLLSAAIIFGNPLMWPFALATLALGLYAIQLASNR